MNKVEVNLSNTRIEETLKMNKYEMFEKKQINLYRINRNSTNLDPKIDKIPMLIDSLIIDLDYLNVDIDNTDNLRKIIEYKIDILRIYKLTQIDFFHSYIFVDNEFKKTIGKPPYYIIYNIHDFTDKVFKFSEGEFTQFQEYWNSWPKSRSDINRSIINSMLNHRMAFFAPLLSDKLTYLITGLESLYLKSVDRQELVYKLAHKASSVIGNFYKDKDIKSNSFDFLKVCYNLRSKIIHGEIVSNLESLNNFCIKKEIFFNSQNVHALWVRLEKYLRISILFFHKNQKILNKNNINIYSNPVLFQEWINTFFSEKDIIIGDK